MKWLWLLLPRRLRPPEVPEVPESNERPAKMARLKAEAELRRAQRDWPRVEAAHDDLASWLDSALGRGGRR